MAKGPHAGTSPTRPTALGPIVTAGSGHAWGQIPPPPPPCPEPPAELLRCQASRRSGIRLPVYPQMTAFNLIPHSFGLLGRFGSERVMSVNVLHRVLKKKRKVPAPKSKTNQMSQSYCSLLHNYLYKSHEVIFTLIFSGNTNIGSLPRQSPTV